MFGCCCCKEGSVKDRWLNITKVRPNEDGGTPGAPHYTCDPFERFIEGIKEAPSHEDDLSWCESQTGCSGCGAWLQGADMNGYSAQDTDLVDKIMSCGSEDATHQQLDHNCYEKSGTVDMRVSGRRGGRWILGKKFWHGAKGIRDRNDPHQIISIACTTGRIDAGGGVFTSTYADETAANFPKAYQARFLKSEINGTFNAHYINASTGGVTDYNAAVAASAIVDRLTGLQSKSGSATLLNDWTDLEDSFDTIQGDWNTFMSMFASFVFSTTNFPDAYVVQNGDSTYELWTGGADDYLHQSISVGYGGTTKKEWVKTLIDGTLQYKMTRDEFLMFSNTGATLSRVIYSWAGSHVPGNPEVEYDITETLEITIELSEPYTNADCLKDFYAALRAWNLANNNLHYISAGRNWRRDETLALAPLVIYDEVQSAVSPSPNFGSIDLYSVPNTGYSLGSDDYEQAQDADDYLGRSVGDPDYIPTWHKRGYIDPAGYMWQAPDGSRGAGGTAFSTLLGAMRKGWIIAAGIEGGERLFWFNADNYERLQDTDLGDPSWHWNWISNGALSDTRLPETTRRWMNLDEAQYDAVAYRGVSVPPPSGNYPQSFLRQQNGVLVGAKYVEATQSWPAVNFGYPCGVGKYDVDQTTVCCIVSGDASVGFVVKQTGDAATALAHNDYLLIEGNGIYQADTVTSIGGGNYTVTVGALLDTLPDGVDCLPYDLRGLDMYGDGSLHLGKLRWPDAPGVCGRVAITTAESGGTVTITVAAQPYLRKNPITGTILVDLYDAAMANKIQATLTRVSDTEFTFTHAAIPDHVWMTGRDVVYTDNSDTRQRTGVRLAWTFDNRSARLPSLSQPLWLGGTAAGDGTGIGGCTGLSMSEFTFNGGSCPAAVGWVPFYSKTPSPSAIPNPAAAPSSPEPVENFGNQTLFAMPDVFDFDDTYGALWMGAVEMVMTNPFWQTPYKPTCALGSEGSLPDWQAGMFYTTGDEILDTNGNIQIAATDGISGPTAPLWATSGDTTDNTITWSCAGAPSITSILRWIEDNGSGQPDPDPEIRGSVTIYTHYYPHRKWVEARCTIPAGKSLPSGIELFYATGSVISPADGTNVHYDPVSGGIVLGANDGSYRSIERPWGFTDRACADPLNRFWDFYETFTNCP